MDKENVVYTYKRILLSLKKRMKFCNMPTTWVDLEDIMLSEINQTKTDTVQFHLYQIPKVVKFIKSKIRMEIIRC